MKSIIKLLTIAFAYLLFSFTVNAEVKIDFTKYDVRYKVLQNSSVDIVEEISVAVNGNFHGLRRDILVENYKCQNSSNTCGGFDLLFVQKITDAEGRDITNQVRQYEVIDDTGKYLRLEWEIYSDGKYVNNLDLSWNIHYTVWGSLKFFDKEAIAYWNLLPADRLTPIRSSRISIDLPSNINFDRNRFQLYTSSAIDSSFNGNRINLEAYNILPGNDLTFSYKFKPGEIQTPSYLTVNVRSPFYGYKIMLDNYDLTDIFQGKSIAIPEGKWTLKVEHVGYEDYMEILDFSDNISITKDIDLIPYPITSIFIFLNNILWCLVPVFLVIGFGLAFTQYRKHGVDKFNIKTIYPQYVAPENFSILTTNTLISEKSDFRDISGQIILLCVKGFIHIIQNNNDSIILKLVKNINDSELSAYEKKFIDYLFETDEIINLHANSINLAPRIIKLNNLVDEVTNSEGLFTKNPKVRIAEYVGFGSLILSFSFSLLFISGAILTNLIGYISTLQPAFIVFALGVGYIVLARFMPARTQKGSELLNKVLGFKMYLNTAERFTLENLKVEEFEKNLPYAIALGVEQTWASRFAELGDKLNLSWLENYNNIGTMGIYRIMQTLNQNVTTISRSYSTPTTGSGWSSGGRFSGFSGGGGGGGRAGGW
jgi:uncharacterized membrane protein YgcG